LPMAPAPRTATVLMDSMVKEAASEVQEVREVPLAPLGARRR